MDKLRIVSRNSKLAMWQATHVQDLLVKLYPDIQIEIIGITTEGDRILDKSLDKIGGKGLFIKELETHLLNKTADIAVHSLKDLPANLFPEFSLAAILKRENPYDAFVSNKYLNLEEMPEGSIIGTSSARRSAILKRYYPHLIIKMLRGNLQTRLAKLDNNEYDAIILAVAGLKRLDLENRIKTQLSGDKFIPAIGQGVLAIEINKDRTDLEELLKPLNDEDTLQAVSAEREMGRFLNASCNIPIAGYAYVLNDKLTLRAMLADSDDSKYIDAEVSGYTHECLEVGEKCAKRLIELGAKEITEKYNNKNI
ncbi:MAG: hydroxymethylbilane synthase [Burkholderiales bacterium]|nr:hydroxymethylbilane synthase [Burkholderiales bacterium]